MEEKDNINENLEEVEIIEEEKTEEVVEKKEEIVEKVEEKEEVIRDTFYSPVEIESEDKLFETINTNQITFNNYYNKVRKTSSLIMIICMVVIVVLLFVLNSVLEGSGIVFSIIAVVAYFLIISNYSKKTKNKLNEDSLRILNEYFSLIDSYVTENKYFTEIQFNREYKLDEDTFKNLKICKNISSVVGRDYIKGKLCGYDFVAGDNCIKTQEKDEKGNEQNYIVFLGKLFVINIENLVSEGRAIIYLKGKGANGPTDIEDLEKVEGILSNKFDVYSSFNIDSLLTEKTKSLLEKFEVNDALIDMFITIDNNKISFGFSYSDGVMVVPLTESLKKEDLFEYKKNVELMVDIVKSLK